MDPLNPPKKLQNLIHRDESASSESPTELTPSQEASLADTVATLNLALDEEEKKRTKLSSEYKDLESRCASETKSHLDQIDQLRKENTDLRKENTEFRKENTELRKEITDLREEIGRLYSNIDKMGGLFTQMLAVLREMKNKE